MYYLKLGLMVLFEPQQAFTLIKRHRKSIPVFVPLILLLLCLAVRVASIYLTHFPLAAQTPENTNLEEPIFELLVPLFSWIGGIYLVTTIRDGEMTFYEVLLSVSYSLLPYILLGTPLALSTHLMSANELSLYQTLKFAVLLWCGILLFYSILHMNSYSFLQTVFNCLLAIFAILFIWAVLVLLFILSEKLIDFFAEVISEYRLLGKTY